MSPWMLLALGCLADLRPSEIDPSAPSSERGAEGRRLVEAAADAHGLDAWRRHVRTQVRLNDTWVGASRLFNPWPAAEISIDLDFATGGNDVSGTFLGGPTAGWTWGLSGDDAYTIDPSGARADVDDDDLRFMLPTVQYFIEMPLRMPEAEFLQSAGEVELEGQTFDRVYATWGSLAANRTFDQYDLYYGTDSGRLERAAYTVRDIAPFVTGVAHFLDYREVDGVWLAHEVRITTSVESLDEGSELHTFDLEAVRHSD